MLVTVSTICPVTNALAPAFSRDLFLILGMKYRMRKIYPTNHENRAIESVIFTVVSIRAAPTTEAKANSTV